jgi:hypothetical protein
MGQEKLAVALSMIVAAAAPAAASRTEQPVQQGAPAASADARYCLKVEAVTGSMVEKVHCETREGWTDHGVDVDKEWAREGVRVIASRD